MTVNRIKKPPENFLPQWLFSFAAQRLLMNQFIPSNQFFSLRFSAFAGNNFYKP
jgi:hypothetical protein